MELAIDPGFFYYFFYFVYSYQAVKMFILPWESIQTALLLEPQVQSLASTLGLFPSPTSLENDTGHHRLIKRNVVQHRLKD